jgi:hypothetical protein
MLFSSWIGYTANRTPDFSHPDYDWQSRFKAAGQHEVTIFGQIDDVQVGPNRTDFVTVPTGGICKVEPKRLEPPKRLYRAARPGLEGKMMWFDDYKMAQLLCDARPGSAQIWTCEADEVYGLVCLNRVEAGDEFNSWNEWIVKPKNVRRINRWRDPFADVPNLEQWQERGVHAVEASSLVNAWTKYHGGKQAPMDRDQGGYWLSQFQGIGQFVCHMHADGVRHSIGRIDIQPASELAAPAVLYRGSSEKLNKRWSWTAEPETAQAFVKRFAPDDGKVWTCQADQVLGVIYSHAENLPPEEMDLAEFSEWIIYPDESTIREWTPGG